MNLKNKLAAAMVLAASASMAQAATYDVTAIFADGGVQGATFFNGSFDWDGSSVSNFSGLLSESMWTWNTTTGSWQFPKSVLGTDASTYVSPSDSAASLLANPTGSTAGEAPLLSLTNQLVNTDLGGGMVSVGTFLQNDTCVTGGTTCGYNVDSADGGTAMTTGGPTDNAFFQMVLDTSSLTDTSATVAMMTYGDATPLGMMMPLLTGSMGMTGVATGGSMDGTPYSLSITQVAAVPLPGAVWLFGGALLSLFGANRRKSVLPA